MMNIQLGRPGGSVAWIALCTWIAGIYLNHGNLLGQEAETGFLMEHPGPSLHSPAVRSSSALRQRQVRMGDAYLHAGRPAVPRAGIPLELHCFADARFVMIVSRVEQRAHDEWVATGTIRGQPGSLALVAVSGRGLAGFVSVPGRGSYRIEGTWPGELVVRELVPGAWRCGTCETPTLGEASPQTAGGRPPTADEGWTADANRSAGLRGSSPLPLAPADGSQTSSAGIGKSSIAPVVSPAGDLVTLIDVLVCYTAAARSAAGGADALESQIALAVEEANAVYQNSGVTARFRLAHRQELAYEESSSFSTNLTRLRLAGDGFLDEVHTLRDAHAADLVCLVTENGEAGFGGLARLLQNPVPASRDTGFSVVRRDALVGEYVFAHEVSHNLGCQHDRANALDAEGQLIQGAFPYAFGHRLVVGGVEYRTIMAYPPGTVLPFLSSPSLTYLGVPLGVDASLSNSAADNARTVRETAPVVGAYSGALIQTRAPALSWVAPADGVEAVAGVPLDVQVETHDADGVVRQVEIYDGLELLTVVSQPASNVLTWTWAQAPPGFHRLTVRAVDDLGAASALPERFVVVRPAHDAFEGRLVLSGPAWSVPGSNAAATREPGEPVHSGNPGDGSVWYRWIAPANGTVLVRAEGTTYLPLVAAYQGVAVTALTVAHRTVSYDPPRRLASAQIDVTAGQELAIAVDSLPGEDTGFTLSLEYLAAPPNDLFSARTVIAGETVGLAGVNLFATKETGEPSHTSNSGGKSVWYDWTAPRDGAVLVTCSGTNVTWLVDAYRGLAVNALTGAVSRTFLFDQKLFVTRLVFTATAGERYAIAVDGLGGKSGVFAFDLSYPTPPANDQFAARIAIPSAPATVQANNLAATAEPGEGEHAGKPPAKSIWYEWRAHASGPVRVRVTGDKFTPLPDVYEGSSLDALKGLNRGVQTITNFVTELSFNAVLNRTYALVVDGMSGKGGDLVLTLTATNAPAQLRPTTVSLQDGANLEFEVEGTPGQRYALDVSEDLVTWTELRTAALPHARTTLREPLTVPLRTRFYRIRPLP